MKRTTLLALAVSVLFANYSIYSQSTISSASGSATGSGGTSTYTIGQLVYTFHSEDDSSISQGVQHPFEFMTLSSQKFTSIYLKASTYPNPTSDNVIIEILDSDLNDIAYNLFDLRGKIIAYGSISNNNTQIKMQHLSIGTYLLKLTKNKQILKTFKIIKK